MDFTTLHHQSTPLLLASVWDAASARAAQRAGYRVPGTSSAAIAAMLGYDDGEEMTFAELLFVVKRIRAACDLPLSVDMEAGYGETAQQITANLQQLAQLGVRRISMGNAAYAALQTRLNHLLSAVQTQQSFGGVFRAERD